MYLKSTKGNIPNRMNGFKRTNPCGDGKVLRRRKKIGVVNDLKKKKGKTKIPMKRNPSKDIGWISAIKNKYKSCTDYLTNGKRLSGNNTKHNRKSTPKISCQSRRTSCRHKSPYSKKSHSPFLKSNESCKPHNYSFYSQKERNLSKISESRKTNNSPYSQQRQSPYSKSKESRRTSQDTRCMNTRKTNNSPYSQQRQSSYSKSKEPRRTSQDTRCMNTRKTHNSPYSQQSRSPYTKSNEPRRTSQDTRCMNTRKTHNSRKPHNSPYSKKSHSPFSKSNESCKPHNYSFYSRKERNLSKISESRKTHNSTYSQQRQSPYSKSNESRRTSQDTRCRKKKPFVLHSSPGVNNKWSGNDKSRGSRRSIWQFHGLNNTYSLWNSKHRRYNRRSSPKIRHRNIGDDIHWSARRRAWKRQPKKYSWDDGRKSSCNTKRRNISRDSPIKRNWGMNAISSTFRLQSPQQRTRRNWREGRAKYMSSETLKSNSFLYAKHHVIRGNRSTVDENERTTKCKPYTRKSGFSVSEVANERNNSSWKNKVNESKFGAAKSPKRTQTKYTQSNRIITGKRSFGKIPTRKVKSWLSKGIPIESRNFGNTINIAHQNTKLTPIHEGTNLTRKNTFEDIGQKIPKQCHRILKMSPRKENGEQAQQKNEKEKSPVKVISNCTNKDVEPHKDPQKAYRNRRTSEWIDKNCIPLVKSDFVEENISHKRKKNRNKRKTNDTKNKIHRSVKSEPFHLYKNTISNTFVAPNTIPSKRKLDYKVSPKSSKLQKNFRRSPQNIESRKKKRQKDNLPNKNPNVIPKKSTASSHKRKEDVLAEHNLQPNSKSEHGNRISRKRDTPSKQISKWNPKSRPVGLKDQDSFDEFRIKVPKPEPSSILLESCWCRFCMGLTSKRPLSCLFAFEDQFNHNQESQNITGGGKSVTWDPSFVERSSNVKKNHSKENADKRRLFNTRDGAVAFHHMDVGNLWSRGDCASAPQISRHNSKYTSVTQEAKPKEIDLVVVNKEIGSEISLMLNDKKSLYAVTNPFKLIEKVNKRYGQTKKHLTLQIRKLKLNDGEPKTNLKLIWS